MAIPAMDSLAICSEEAIELPVGDPRYPDRLRRLADAPPALHLRGDAALLTRRRLVAVVGTREPTAFGLSATHALTGALADGGWGIVSGLAPGIDTIAHRVALERRVPTIAVIGGGLDHIHPPANGPLARRIVEEGGALISEQPDGERAQPRHLIARDRLQSALSLAVLIAQSDLRSGTMHTARFAAAQGRPLFCVVPDDEDDAGASEGLRVLLERPARELCSLLPAWREASALCARLGERPLAHPVRLDDLDGFVRAVEAAADNAQDAAGAVAAAPAPRRAP
jgi:DNA protecting protein DprA